MDVFADKVVELGLLMRCLEDTRSKKQDEMYRM